MTSETNYLLQMLNGSLGSSNPSDDCVASYSDILNHSVLLKRKKKGRKSDEDSFVRMTRH